jgi:hypothetical protein
MASTTAEEPDTAVIGSVSSAGSSFPLTVQQLLPVAEVLSRTSKHFDNLNRFLRSKLPPGFPVKVHLFSRSSFFNSARSTSATLCLILSLRCLSFRPFQRKCSSCASVYSPRRNRRRASDPCRSPRITQMQLTMCSPTSSLSDVGCYPRVELRMKYKEYRHPGAT